MRLGSLNSFPVLMQARPVATPGKCRANSERAGVCWMWHAKRQVAARMAITIRRNNKGASTLTVRRKTVRDRRAI